MMFQEKPVIPRFRFHRRLSSTMKRKNFGMRKLLFCLPVLFVVPFAHAQSAIDFAVGGGTATDTSNHSGIDNGNSVQNAFGPCIPGTGDVNCQTTPSMGGFFL